MSTIPLASPSQLGHQKWRDKKRHLKIISNSNGTSTSIAQEILLNRGKKDQTHPLLLGNCMLFWRIDIVNFKNTTFCCCHFGRIPAFPKTTIIWVQGSGTKSCTSWCAEYPIDHVLVMLPPAGCPSKVSFEPVTKVWAIGMGFFIKLTLEMLGF